MLKLITSSKIVQYTHTHTQQVNMWRANIYKLQIETFSIGYAMQM